MADRTKMRLLGPGRITLDGTDVGYVSKVKLTFPGKTVVAKTAAYGDGELDHFDLGGSPKISFDLDEIGLATYAKVIIGATRNTSGSDEDLTTGKFAGKRLTAMEFVYTPIDSVIATLFAVKAWRVVPSDGDRVVDQGIEQTQQMNTELTCLVDESKTEGEKYLRFGVVAVSADTTPPTLSSIAPTDGQTLSAPSTIVMTFSEALNPDTVIAANISVYNYTDQTPVAGTLSLNAAGTVVTFTPTVAFTSAKIFITQVSSGLKDASNNAFAGDIYKFTTT